MSELIPVVLTLLEQVFTLFVLLFCRGLLMFSTSTTLAGSNRRNFALVAITFSLYQWKVFLSLEGNHYGM